MVTFSALMEMWEECHICMDRFITCSYDASVCVHLAMIANSTIKKVKDIAGLMLNL
jgi:hypothetical protein